MQHKRRGGEAWRKGGQTGGGRCDAWWKRRGQHGDHLNEGLARKHEKENENIRDTVHLRTQREEK